MNPILTDEQLEEMKRLRAERMADVEPATVGPLISERIRVNPEQRFEEFRQKVQAQWEQRWVEEATEPAPDADPANTYADDYGLTRGETI